MSVTRANIGRGPAVVTFGGASLFTRDDLVPRHSPVWNPVPTSMFDEVDKYKSDLVIKIALTLWGAWESLSVLFPSGLLDPDAGSSIFSGADQALVVLGRNGDQITYHNARLTKLGDLYLGVDSELWAAAVEFTALLKDATEPETAAAYYTVATGASYSENVFAKTNFKRARFTGAWGAKTGFTAIVPQKGFHIGWDLRMAPVKVDGYGTVDFTLQGLRATCKCIPIGPTLAQLEAEVAAQGKAMGTVLSAANNAGAADLTLSSAVAPTCSIVLKNAGMTEHGYAFGTEPIRMGEATWETTRGFTAGASNAVATVA